MDDLTIRQIITSITDGQIRIPAFQRGFVWDSKMVAYLMDSIYKGYPFGSILLWRTKERLKSERKLGPFELPEAKADYPVDYILDGQQRITSLFGVFQTEITSGEPESWTKIYFDYVANPDVQESQFLALAEEDVVEDRHFLLRNLFDTTGYRRATKDMNEETATKIDKLQAVFKEARIPIQTLTTENRTTVAIVFERVNQRGVELDTLQLLSAWAWSEEFDLQIKFAELADELEPFGFKEVGDDKNLLLRCCAGVLANDATITTLMGLNGAVVRERFEEVVNGIKGAIDFLKAELNIHSLHNLPYPAFLVPLAVFFSNPGTEQLRYNDEQRKTLLKWFWRTCFSRRYNSQPIKSLQSDISEVIKLKNKKPNELGNISVSLSNSYFAETTFRANTVNTKAFILLLAQKKPLSFITGANVSLAAVLKEYNRNEFHHLYARAYLGKGKNKYDTNCLANFCFLSQADNNALGGVAPSEYRKKLGKDVSTILERAICPASLFSDNFKAFIEERSKLLVAEAQKVME